MDLKRMCFSEIVKKIFIYLLWFYIVLSIIVVLLFFFGARHIGKLEAEYDLWRGRYEIHGFGLIMGVPYEIEVLEPYGIKYKHVAGCLVNGFIMDSVATYNLKMLEAIKENLGIEIDWPVIFFEDALKNGKGMEGVDQDSEQDTVFPQILMHTQEPAEGEDSFYEIDECFDVIKADVDGDLEQEDLCLSYLNYKGYDDRFIYTSLVINLIKGFKHVLRQELDRSYYFEERFVSLKDINADGREELITHVRLSPDCAGCDAYRIYEYKSGRFILKLSLFDIDPDNDLIGDVWDQVDEYDKTILTNLKSTRGSEYPCGFSGNCRQSAPWLVDTDHDGKLEIIVLVETAKDDFDFNGQFSYLFFATHLAKDKTLNYHLKPIPLGYSLTTNTVGLLKTRDKRTHLLINAASSGTSSAFPKLNVFDAHWPTITKIAEFSGFYEHAIAERLRDLDGDGNTEIIYVGETYQLPGHAHASIELSYDIAEYRGGHYVENNLKFESTLELINKKQGIDETSFQEVNSSDQEKY